MQQAINIVWFKRDLRTNDHAPLRAAIADGLPVLLLYVFEPSVMAHHDSDVRHWRFVHESLQDLQSILGAYHHRLYYMHNEVQSVFEQLRLHYTIKNVFSHQETGNALTFSRDRQMSAFFKWNGIVWKEYQTNGVIRLLKQRLNWEKRWEEFMQRELEWVDLKKLHSVILEHNVYLQCKGEDLPSAILHPEEGFQRGGETMGWRYLTSFFAHRHRNYSAHISKPHNSRTGCSRLSPYLAYGNLSMRQVYQQAQRCIINGGSKRDLNNFISRLYWHCHFIQKFESECRIEVENHNRALDAIVKPRKLEYIKAFENAQTGVPIIDACITCLVNTGYINFRMRAMLVSFFVFNLWQDWRDLHFLARVFLDYEPGIHYPQLQMQAGTTGINTLRIYNPIKNSEEHDPQGTFIHKWLPQLVGVPLEHLHQPWSMSPLEQELYKCIIGKDYPAPIVDLEATRREASEIMWGFRKNNFLQEENKRIINRHTNKGSTFVKKRIAAQEINQGDERMLGH